MDKKHIDEKYGEFVCSYFAWLQPSSQKEKAKELSNMTKKKEDKRWYINLQIEPKKL